eukprot:TRINITY_DN38009_c0_g2_i1.p1 TRINITY_DN38009_c0_g2~~TRINITY_DN38009_c0_g2_i1.p1  ORF type:complete len:744 (-),score=68.41 TRINITY_DN38009_c0_g2_i1:127-2358(-)
MADIAKGAQRPADRPGGGKFTPGKGGRGKKGASGGRGGAGNDHAANGGPNRKGYGKGEQRRTFRTPETSGHAEEHAPVYNQADEGKGVVAPSQDAAARKAKDDIYEEVGLLVDSSNGLLERRDFDGQIRQFLHATYGLGGRPKVREALQVVQAGTAQKTRQTMKKPSAFIITLLRKFFETYSAEERAQRQRPYSLRSANVASADGQGGGNASDDKLAVVIRRNSDYSTRRKPPPTSSLDVPARVYASQLLDREHHAEFLCRLCSKLVQDATVLPCSHLLCRSCARTRVIEDNESEPLCPACRLPFPKDHVLSDTSSGTWDGEVVGSIQIKCVFADVKGFAHEKEDPLPHDHAARALELRCDWVGPVAKYDAHLRGDCNVANYLEWLRNDNSKTAQPASGAGSVPATVPEVSGLTGVHSSQNWQNLVAAGGQHAPLGYGAPHSGSYNPNGELLWGCGGGQPWNHGVVHGQNLEQALRAVVPASALSGHVSISTSSAKPGQPSFSTTPIQASQPSSMVLHSPAAYPGQDSGRSGVTGLSPTVAATASLPTAAPVPSPACSAPWVSQGALGVGSHTDSKQAVASDQAYAMSFGNSDYVQQQAAATAAGGWPTELGLVSSSIGDHVVTVTWCPPRSTVEQNLLSVREGEHVYITWALPEGWAHAALQNGAKGWLPTEICRRRVFAVVSPYEENTGSPELLRLRIGDRVVVYHREAGGWTYGARLQPRSDVIPAERGWFPSWTLDERS